MASDKGQHQVWPLTQFFLFPFFVKNLCFAWRANHWPLIGDTLFSVFPPSNCLGPLKGFSSWHGALQGPSTRLVRCFLNYIDTRTPCAALGVEVPTHHQKQLTQALIVRLLKMHFFTPILDCGKSTEWNWVSDQTWVNLSSNQLQPFRLQSRLRPRNKVCS